MTDHVPRKTDGEGGVNGGRAHRGRPDLAAWDHKPGDRTAQQYLSRGTSEAAVLNEVNQPSAYERLSDDAKAALQEWIERELVPANKTAPDCSYVLKHIFARLPGGFYVNNGEFKGAMLVAGYEPLDRTELSWQFSYRLADPHLYERSLRRERGKVT